MTEMTDLQVFVTWLWIAIGGSILLYIIARIVVFVMAWSDFIFTFRIEGRFKYIMKGRTLYRIIYKLPGYKFRGGDVDENGLFRDIEGYDVIPSPGVIGGDEQMSATAKRFERIFGAVWVGIPPFSVLEFEFEWERKPKPTDDPNKREYQVVKIEDAFTYVHRSDKTRYLFFKQVYSLAAPSVELSDQVTVNIWGTETIMVRNAYRPFLLDGKWFPHVKDAALGAVQDYCGDETLASFRTKPKGILGSTLEKAIIASAGENPDGTFSPTGTIATTGMAIVAFNFGGWSEGADSKAVTEATRNVEIADLKLQQARKDGEAQATLILQPGSAKATVLGLQGVELDKHPGLVPVSVSENIGNGVKNASTVVLGNSGVTPLINIPATPAPNSPQNPPTQTQQGNNP